MDLVGSYETSVLLIHALFCSACRNRCPNRCVPCRSRNIVGPRCGAELGNGSGPSFGGAQIRVRAWSRVRGVHPAHAVEFSLATTAIEIAPESRPLTQGQSKAILALWMPVHLAGNLFAARCLVRAWEGCFQAYAPPQIWQRRTLDSLTADDSARTGADVSILGLGLGAAF